MRIPSVEDSMRAPTALGVNTSRGNISSVSLATKDRTAKARPARVHLYYTMNPKTMRNEAAIAAIIPKVNGILLQIV
jgi:hypothetical protein